MTIETLPEYFLHDVFLNRLVNSCIKQELRVDKANQQTEEGVTRTTFNILRGNNIEYVLSQTQEEHLPEVGQRFGRYASTLSRINGSNRLVIESYQGWISYASSDGESGSREKKTTLGQ